MKRLTLAVLGLVLAAALPSPVHAQAAAAPAGVRGEILGQLDDAATKLVQLAEAIPQDKYSWRPGPGVRSVSEVLMHVTGANYYIAQFVGAQAQSPLPPGADTSVTGKTQVVDYMKRSFDHARGVIRGVADGDLDKPTNMFGRQTTYRNALLLIATHAHEHLGQMIAYARTNGVAPPWSMASN